jgi:hypothetical protein
MNSSSAQSLLPNRWVLAITAFLMQLALGSVYAWSVFLKPVIAVYHVSRLQANLTFSIGATGPGRHGWFRRLPE